MTHKGWCVVKNQTNKQTEPEGLWYWDLVCSIVNVRPTKFVQMMILS